MGLGPSPEMLLGIEYLVEGSESGTWADSRSGYSHCGQSATGYGQTQTGRCWCLADRGYSQSGPSQPDSHQREVGRRLGRAGQCRLTTRSRKARDVEERTLTVEDQSRG